MIDTHIHLYDPAWGDYAWPPVGSEWHRVISAAQFREAASGAQAVVVGCSSEPALNRCILDATRDDPTVAAYIRQLDGDGHLADTAQELSVYPKYRGFRVIASTITDPGVLDGSPGIVELQGNYRYTWKLLPYVAAHPERRFIVEHVGGYLFDGGMLAEDYAAFCRDFAALPNTAMKVSGLYTLCRLSPKPQPSDAAELFRDVVMTVLRTFGEDRCMFGSDWPVLGVPYAWAVEATRTLCGELSETVWEKVSDLNARCIYSL